MLRDHEDRLAELFDNYSRSWGPVQWRELCAKIEVGQDVEHGSMLSALSLIEADSAVMRRKLAATRADRSNPIKQFNVLWLAEEAEHGRALQTASEMLRTRVTRPLTRPALRDVRSAATWPALYVSGWLVPHLEAVYCTLGSMQEYIALTTYRHIGKRVGDPALQELLECIARQEARHMRFYREAAKVLLEPPQARWVTTALMARLWRPPGVDLLGLRVWLDVFGPLFTDGVYVRQLLRVDEILGNLTGHCGVRPMQRFIDSAVPLRCMASTE